MKRLLAIILVLVFLVSCGKVPIGMNLEEVIKEKFQTEKKVITLGELVEEDWEHAWLVNKFEKDAAMPEELIALEPSESPRIILIKDGNLKAFEFPGTAEILYPKSFYVTALELGAESEFLIDKLDGKYRLIYQEEEEEPCPV
ncbi:MAG: hypothetical protein GX046_09720 [Tissierellia bacterium]|nr:hypothetical protein [Tissierellia bacterium]